ncbi:interleukin enhancer-binding factor 3 homolog isoform X2 [Eurytemora carolleeae]|uniref:interleukin enhancer-binding factor 3 homolog isoform X2 n=1 Tax=Eurytemora carolleeae TaxID=1294199 RepID=UPI000C78A733|nr:interleukin enhancer-binding factor 3 homolog isoform X2 [Eurytemora carolleeae]|eukprot:XP_023342504.1 interleukin enhancer-binding factor 3 homolog isoform X2 [Eurytemora affinis]
MREKVVKENPKVVKEEKEEKENGNEEVKEEKEENEEMAQDEDDKVVEEEEEDPVGMLPKEACLEALAELRHAKWFTTMAGPLESCAESIRIFKDMSRRVPAFACIGDWGIELLCERSIATSLEPPTPSLAILRCLEVLASGLLSADGFGIKDPCEREARDVCVSLTPQEREDITALAQDYVRKIHFRKMWQVLGIEKSPSYKERKAQEAKAKEAAQKAAQEAKAKEAAEDTVKTEVKTE